MVHMLQSSKYSHLPIQKLLKVFEVAEKNLLLEVDFLCFTPERGGYKVFIAVWFLTLPKVTKSIGIKFRTFSVDTNTTNNKKKIFIEVIILIGCFAEFFSKGFF